MERRWQLAPNRTGAKREDAIAQGEFAQNLLCKGMEIEELTGLLMEEVAKISGL